MSQFFKSVIYLLGPVVAIQVYWVNQSLVAKLSTLPGDEYPTNGAWSVPKFCRWHARFLQRDSRHLHARVGVGHEHDVEDGGRILDGDL